MRRHKLFGLIAPELGWVPPPGFLLRRDRILRALGDRPPSQLLEVGAGAGALAVELAGRGFSCVAFETSRQGRDAIAKLASAAGVEVEATDTPVECWAGAFPLVMAFEVLEHIEDDAGALRAWAGWMAPGATFLLSVPAHASKWGAGDVWAGHFRRYEQADLVALLEREGFEVQHIESWGFPAANLLAPISNLIYRSRLRARSASTDKAEASAESGVNRDLHVRLAWLITNPLSALALRLLFWVQGLFARRDLGVGYLVVARKL